MSLRKIMEKFIYILKSNLKNVLLERMYRKRYVIKLMGHSMCVIGYRVDRNIVIRMCTYEN